MHAEHYSEVFKINCNPPVLVSNVNIESYFNRVSNTTYPSTIGQISYNDYVGEAPFNKLDESRTNHCIIRKTLLPLLLPFFNDPVTGM
jgi:hypothetical protein